MASDNTSVVASPKKKSGETFSVVVSPKAEGGGAGGGGKCLCSPTTHQGSFRCRFHRSQSKVWIKRSKSMPANKDVAPAHT